MAMDLPASPKEVLNKYRRLSLRAQRSNLSEVAASHNDGGGVGLLRRRLAMTLVRRFPREALIK